MKRYIVVLIALLVVCNGLIGAGVAHPAQAQAELKIGLVTDVGQVDDRSFNQSAWQGAKLAADALGGTADFIETIDPTDYANNIRLFTEQGYNVIITTGAAIGEASLAAAQQYPKVHFISVDVNVEALLKEKNLTLENVTGLIFPEDQSGFLSGVLAARMSKTNIIAAVLPTDQLQPVVNFRQGYEAGAKYAKSDIKIFATYHPGGLSVAFDDPVWGAQTAGQAIDLNADVIFSGGGKTGNGGLQEVARRTTPEKPLYCIGVDIDQWFTVPEAHPCLITSGLKLIMEGVDELVRKVADGTIKGGNFVGKVGLAPFHDFESLVPPEVVSELDQIKADLESGKLKTDGTQP
jgi:basic membrane protein A